MRSIRLWLEREISYLRRNPIKIEKDTEKYKEMLFDFSDRELCEIHCTLNCGKWDKRLGEEPEWHKREQKSYDSVMYVARRDCNILKEIERIVGKKEVLRHWNVEVNGRSQSEFEEFWRTYCINETT